VPAHQRLRRDRPATTDWSSLPVNSGRTPPIAHYGLRMTNAWSPESIRVVQSLIDSGMANESLTLDFKAALPANKSLAKHFAAFAIHGGTVVVGVAENTSAVFVVEPIEIAGQPERVEQIAQTLVDPPITVSTRVLLDPTDPSSGLLVIEIPPSSNAPHQVDGRYYERGDKQSRPMTDSSVERLMAARRLAVDAMHVGLEAAMGRDPCRGTGQLAHIFMVARPLGATHDELYGAIGGTSGWSAFASDVRMARPHQQLSNGEWAPTLAGNAHHQGSRPGGYAITSLDAREGRTCTSPDPGVENHLLDLEIKDDGSVEYFCGRGSDVFGDKHLLFPRGVVGACLDVIAAVRCIGSKTGVPRQWDLGLAVTHTEGLRAWTKADFAPVTAFAEDQFLAYHRASNAELTSAPWTIARSLTRRFVEGCGLTFSSVAQPLGAPTES